jgi:hypothetical protein
LQGRREVAWAARSRAGKRRKGGEFLHQRTFGQVALRKVHPKISVAFLRLAGAARQASSRRADVAELEQKRRQRSADLVLTGRSDHLADEALFIGDLLLAVDTGTTSVVACLTQEDIARPAGLLVRGEHGLDLRPTGLGGVASGGPDGRQAGHTSGRTSGAVDVVGDVVNTSWRNAVAAEHRRLALDQRNDDLDIGEAGSVERAAQVLGGGGDRRGRLRPENLVAQLNADYRSVLQKLSGRRIERRNIGGVGVVRTRFAKSCRGPGGHVTACAAEERCGVVTAAVREGLAAVGTVRRRIRLGQSGDTVVVQAENNLDPGALRRRQDVVVGLVDGNGAGIERLYGVQVRVETRLAVRRAGGQHIRSAGGESQLRVARDRRGGAPVVVAAAALRSIIDVDSAEGGCGARSRAGCCQTSTTASGAGKKDRDHKDRHQLNELPASWSGIVVLGPNTRLFTPCRLFCQRQLGWPGQGVKSPGLGLRETRATRQMWLGKDLLGDAYRSVESRATRS